MKMIYADGVKEKEFISLLHSREGETVRNVNTAVAEIIADVSKTGDKALKEYTRRFDKCELDSFEVSAQEIDEAFHQCDGELFQTMKRAAENIRAYHEKQKQSGFVVTKPDGILMGQKVRGLSRVGIYVPGGRAAYPSSVLMNAIPAKVADVKELIMVTPPQPDGSVNPNILAAAKIAGVDRIFKIGGAQAVAALAYGTESIPKVDKIVGPGNIYVATAKRMVYGLVDIDMIAGPSEVLVIADETAEPKFLAADLMSQAEHDPMASAILVTTVEDIGRKTIAEIERQMQNLSKKDIIKESIMSHGAVIICRSLDEAVKIANDIAPEHLELMVSDPVSLLGSVDNAGSVFLGKWSPEPLGDYFAGPNHVLPTNGTARFFSPLSVDSFVKKLSFINYSEQALKAAAPDITRFALSEGLTAHANSISVRFQ